MKKTKHILFDLFLTNFFYKCQLFKGLLKTENEL